MSTTNTNPLEDANLALQKAQEEDRQITDKIIKELEVSTAWKTLDKILGSSEETSSFLDKIKTSFSKIHSLENEEITENLYKATEAIIDTLNLSPENKAELYDLIVNSVEETYRNGMRFLSWEDIIEEPISYEEEFNEEEALENNKEIYWETNYSDMITEEEYMNSNNKIKQHPDYPTLENLVENGVIEETLLYSITSLFWWNIDLAIEWAIKTLDISNKEKKDKLDIINTNIDKNEALNKANFSKDFWEDFKELYKNNTITSDKTKEWTKAFSNNNLLEKIAENYIVNENKGTLQNKTSNLNIAMDITINEMLDWKQNVNIEKIENLKKEIRLNNNTEDKFNIMVYIKDFINKEEGVLGNIKSKEEQKQINKENKQLKNINEYKEEINKLLKVASENNNKKLQQQLKESQAILEEEKKIPSEELPDILTEMDEIIWESKA